MTLRLNRQSLATLPEQVARPGYDRDGAGIGIVHLGPGAFHRAHQAAFTDAAMAVSGGNWAILGVSPRSPDIRDALSPQDFLYTLVTLGEKAALSVIGAIREIVTLRDKSAYVLDRMAHPETKIVSLTVTEKGYCLAQDGELDFSHPDIAHDLEHSHAPVSAVGLIAEAMNLRKERGVAPFTAISCDNISENGSKLKRAVASYADAVYPGLSAWLEDQAAFPNTMVDAITPATDEGLRDMIEDKTGVHDAWPVQRETFAQWVIEPFDGPKPDWEAVGVQFAADVPAFEAAKLRVLNASHSALAYLGSLAGFETVCEAASEAGLEGFIRRLTDREIIPGLTTPNSSSGRLDLHAYRDAVIERFRNPQIRHELSQIAIDGSEKLRQRVLPVIRENLARGRPITDLCTILAGWRRFCRRKFAKGERLNDPLAEDFGLRAWAEETDPHRVVPRLASFGAFIDAELARDERLGAALVAAEERFGEADAVNIGSAFRSMEAV